MIDIDTASPSSTTALDSQLFESSPDCVELLDAQGCVIAVNKNGQCVMEIDNLAMVAGKPWKALWPEAAHRELDEALTAACEGRVGHFGAYCPTQKGTPKWWDVVITAVRSDAGNIESFLSVSRDVTVMHQASVEREQLLRELQAANARMTDIFKQAPAFMCVLRGPDHVFEMVNEQYLQLVGNRNPVGQTVRQALPELEGQGFFELLDQVFCTGEPFKGTDLPVLLQRTRDTALEERFVDFVYIVLRDAQESITGILVHGVDQTERKQAELRLYDSRERFQKIVHQAGAGVVETNADGCITLANRKYCDMLGYAESELVGMNVLDLTAPDSIFSTQELVAKLRGGAPGFVIDKQYRRRDGFLKWATSSVNTLRDKDGNYQGMVAIVVDITDSRDAAEALRASEERYRTLFDSMDQGFCIIEMMQDTTGKNVDYRFLQMNAMFEQHTGLSGALNKTARQLVPDLDTFWVETYGRVASTGESVRLEHRDPAMNRWFDVHATRIGGTSSKQVALLFRDISARKHDEEALHRYAARQAFQLQVADKVGALVAPDEVTAAASELLGQHLKLSRVFYCEVDDEQGTFFIRQDWTADGVSSVSGQVRRLHDFGPELIADVRAGRMVIVDDITLDARTAGHTEAYTALGIRANAAIPLLKAGRLSAILTLHDNIPHHWTAHELALAQDTVERTWAAVESARAQAELRKERNQSQYVLDTMTEGFALLDRNWTVLQANAEALRITQRVSTDVLGQDHWKIWPELIGTDTERFYRRVREHGVADTLEMSHLLSDEQKIWVELRAYPSLDGGLAVFFRDITKRKEAEANILHASMHDSLTGLPNRAMLFEYAGRMLSHSRRINTCAAVLFLDLDRFKPINDSHGHETGDEVLKEVADRLSRSLRAEDIVVRLGGDEFVILLQDIKSASYAGEVASYIVTKVNEPYLINDLALSLSTSIGISVFPGDGEDIDTLISHADAAMYQAKQAGRNNFQFYSAEFADGVKVQLAIEQQLRSALRCDDFHLCYQPVIDLKTGKVVSVEALIRWSNADIGPERFVPIAEATGIINPIGRWVLKEASRQYKAWLAEGFPAIPIAVNVSIVEFRDRDFVSRFQRLLGEYGIEPTALQLELTETAVMDDIDHAVKVLGQLKAMGVVILLDDFGTGYSSLAYLARLPLNKIKIDKSFVSQLENDLASRAITDTMLTLGHTLGLEVVAEGVESEFALDYIRAHGCQQAQGYIFSKPILGEAFIAWCRHWQTQTEPALYPSQQQRRQL